NHPPVLVPAARAHPRSVAVRAARVAEASSGPLLRSVVSDPLYPERADTTRPRPGLSPAGGVGVPREPAVRLAQQHFTPRKLSAPVVFLTRAGPCDCFNCIVARPLSPSQQLSLRLWRIAG